MNFRTVVELRGSTTTGVQVPLEVVEALGGGKHPSVVVTINGFTYRSSIAFYRGEAPRPASDGSTRPSSS